MPETAAQPAKPTDGHDLRVYVWWGVSLGLLAFVASCSLGCNPIPSRPQGTSAIVPLYFTVNGEIVHPGCIYELIGSIADPLPTIAAVDVEGVRRSNKYNAKPKLEDGWVSFEDKDVLGESGRFRYKLLGSMSPQIYVLEAMDDMSPGTAVFGWLLFATVERCAFTEGTNGCRERMTLRSVGYLGLGDRHHPAVELKGGRVTIGPSEGYPNGRVVSIAAGGVVKVEHQVKAQAPNL